jgi:hypothetical protein
MRKIFKKIVHVQNHSAIEIKLDWFGMFLRLSAAGLESRARLFKTVDKVICWINHLSSGQLLLFESCPLDKCALSWMTFGNKLNPKSVLMECVVFSLSSIFYLYCITFIYLHFYLKSVHLS